LKHNLENYVEWLFNKAGPEDGTHVAKHVVLGSKLRLLEMVLS
jgi:hypothetical protein